MHTRRWDGGTSGQSVYSSCHIKMRVYSIDPNTVFSRGFSKLSNDPHTILDMYPTSKIDLHLGIFLTQTSWIV